MKAFRDIFRGAFSRLRLRAIMKAYRWRDANTVMRYGAKLAAKSGASARLAKRFSGD
jgi:hypothetical protein